MYMAPEQAQGDKLDHRADVFSFGSVLYTLCTGREPFSAASPVVVLRQVCEATPRPIRELNSSIPIWLELIVERLHRKLPAERFGSAAEVAELLTYNLEHPDKPRLLPRPRSGNWLRRNRRSAVAAFGGLVLMLGSLVLASSPHVKDRIVDNAPGHQQQEPLPLRSTLTGHSGSVWSLAFSADGQYLATGSDDTTIHIWDATNWADMGDMAGHANAVFAVAFIDSGKTLLSGSGDGTADFGTSFLDKRNRPFPAAWVGAPARHFTGR